ncbi:MAG: acylneuraminate cytidylyltransferase family protein [Proteobacteria bacterium]|nr:acylneuraminate cytidylyltransferase family protein [Pseudomonadota bacterium]
MNIVGIIHARGGSKRIPLKNIKLLNGKPLISYIIHAALGSKKMNRLIVTSDHPDIMRIAKEWGAEVPFVRPADISEDVPSERVTQHAVTYLEEKENYPVDIAVTFQPTTPFCLSSDIDGCIDLVVHSDADSAWSGYEITQRPEWMFAIDNRGFAQNFLSSKMSGDIGVSQNLPKLYIPNGGIYATKRDALFGQNAIICKKSKVWIMPWERSVDIDEPFDFLLAEIIAKESEAR